MRFGMRFGGMPKEVGQCSYRVAKQLQPGLPPKLIHTVLSTLVLQGGLKSPPMSSSSATSPAELSLRPTLWRTRGNGRRTRPTTTSCARRTLKQPAWLALGRLLPHPPTTLECMQTLRRIQAHSGAIRRTQAHSGAFRRTQAHSDALRCTRTHSGALGRTQASLGRTQASLGRTQAHSGAPRRHSHAT